MPTTSTASSFFTAYFKELEARGIPFVILHSYEKFPEEIRSDVDHAVRCHDLPRLLSIQCEVARKQGWVLASAIRSTLFAQCTVFFHPDDPALSIQLDACANYFERGCFIMRDELLLSDRRKHRSMWVPAPAVEFGYLTAKALIKKKRFQDSLPRLQELQGSDPAGTEHIFQSLFGETVGSLESWLQKPAAEWEQKLRPVLRSRTKLGPINLLREAGRAISRISRPMGIRIVILGPDGAGKSTLINGLGALCFRRTKLFHFRPNLLGKQQTGAPVLQPQAQQPRSRLASVSKTIYYFLDHWLGHLLKTLPALVRNELVIFDRSFEDILVDPIRYRMNGSSFLVRWLARLLPRTDLTIVLDSDPEVIHARKQELSLDELRRQRVELLKLAARLPRCHVIAAAQAPERVIFEVQTRIIAYLAQREARRHRL